MNCRTYAPPRRQIVRFRKSATNNSRLINPAYLKQYGQSEVDTNELSLSHESTRDTIIWEAEEKVTIDAECSCLSRKLAEIMCWKMFKAPISQAEPARRLKQIVVSEID